VLALIFSALHFLSTPSTSTCITNSGKTACGYGCIAAHGEVGCAQTSAGVCGATDRDLICWDPPDSVRAHYGDKAPRPKCLTRSGVIACGYQCAARDSGDVRCASTPDGVCVATSVKVTCWDPPVGAYCLDDKPLPRPKCVTIDGNAACGYGCASRSDEIECAQTPGGKCEILPDQILCHDPESPPLCGGQPCKADDPKTGRWWCRASPQLKLSSP